MKQVLKHSYTRFTMF